MSDDPAAFRAKTKRQFEQAGNHLDGIGRAFIMNLAAALIDSTPGPNLQLADTEYIATGQLRDGWSWGLAAQNEAHRWNDGGSYDDYGSRAFGEIQSAVAGAFRLPAISYLQNDNAYGYIVHEGLGRMPVARPWVTSVAKDAEVYADQAKAEVGRG
jgi:hypothetical protein